MTNLARAATAALLLSGCAGGSALREEVAGLREELRSMRRENEASARRVDALQGRVDALTARLTRPAAEPSRAAPSGAPVAEPASRPAAAAPAPPAERAYVAASPVIPRDLAVVKVKPSRAAPRAAPPVPTSVPLAEPNPAALDALATPGRRGFGAEAEAALKAARALPGDVARAHALEDFVGHYPRHPLADNALVEAANAYDEANLPDAACALVARVDADYPAGDAVSDALERLARCEATHGRRDQERELLERLAKEHPGTPAASRAGARLATISGRADEPSAPGPARSGP